ncbi:MAG TPA: Hsp20/alpha crystallin family protein, partial [Candidatus Paceibacterota bacterium]
DVIDDRMRIRGAIEQDQILRDGEQAYRRERAYGSFSREFSLPAHVKEDQIRAVCKDGVLTIVMHKVEGEKRKKITIEKA